MYKVNILMHVFELAKILIIGDSLKVKAQETFT